MQQKHDKCPMCKTQMILTPRPVKLAPWLPRKEYDLEYCPSCNAEWFPEEASRKHEQDTKAAGVFGCLVIGKGDRRARCKLCRVRANEYKDRNTRARMKRMRVKAIPNQPLRWDGRELGRFTVYVCTKTMKGEHDHDYHWYWENAAVRHLLEYEAWKKRSMRITTTANYADNLQFSPLNFPVTMTMANAADMNWFTTDIFGNIPHKEK